MNNSYAIQNSQNQHTNISIQKCLNGWYFILAWIVPIFGIILGCIKKKDYVEDARVMLQISITSMILKLLYYGSAIFIIMLFFDAAIATK